jgi:hypothetical protein
MYGCTACSQATIGRSLEALKTLWIWFKEDELNTDEILLAKTGDVSNAFRMAAQNNRIEILKKLWIWDEKKQINPKTSKKKCF